MNATQTHRKVLVHMVGASTERPADTIRKARKWLSMTESILARIERELDALDARHQEICGADDEVRQEYENALRDPEQNWQTRRLLRYRYYQLCAKRSSLRMQRAVMKLDRINAAHIVDYAHDRLVATAEQILVRDGRLPHDATRVTFHYSGADANIVAHWGDTQFTISPDGIVHARTIA